MGRVRAADRQREIVGHAARLFRERGYLGATIGDIGDALGLTSAALYYHFRNKDEVLRAVALQGVRAVHEAVRRAIEAEPHPPGRFRAGLRTHLLTCLEYRDCAAVLLQEARHLRPDDRREVLRESDAYEALWAGLLDEAAAAGLFRPGTDLHLLRLLSLGALNWALFWYNPAGARTPAEIADAFVEYIGRGVLADGAAGDCGQEP